MKKAYSRALSGRQFPATARGSNPLRVMVKKSSQYGLYLDHYRGETLLFDSPPGEDGMLTMPGHPCECACAV